MAAGPTIRSQRQQLAFKRPFQCLRSEVRSWRTAEQVERELLTPCGHSSRLREGPDGVESELCCRACEWAFHGKDGNLFERESPARPQAATRGAAGDTGL